MGRDASADDASVDAQLDRAPSLALFKGLALAMGDAVVVNSGVIDDHIDGYRDGAYRERGMGSQMYLLQRVRMGPKVHSRPRLYVVAFSQLHMMVSFLGGI